MRWGISSDISKVKKSLVEWTWKLFICGFCVLFNYANGIEVHLEGNDGVGYVLTGYVFFS